MHDGGDRPFAVDDRRVKFRDHAGFDVDALDAPVDRKRLSQDLDIGPLVAQFEFGKLDIAGGDERIEGQPGQIDLLANDRAVHLAGRRHIDDDVGQCGGHAAEAAARFDRATTLVVGLRGGPR